jgi:hypothetical protein
MVTKEQGGGVTWGSWGKSLPFSVPQFPHVDDIISHWS